MKNQSLKTVLALSVSLAASSVYAATVSKNIEYTLDASSDQIQVINLAGNVRVIPSESRDIRVRGEVFATGDSNADAEKLLAEIEFELAEKGNKDILTVSYPVDDYSHFVYRPDGSGWRGKSNGTYMRERVSVSSKPPRWNRPYAEVYTDLVVELPAEQVSLVKVKVGGIQADDLNNQFTLDTGSGHIKVANSRGTLFADSGSGVITVSDFVGDVNADSGSGSVNLTNIVGDMFADTGSGNVTFDKVAGDLKADTGSGNVKVLDYQGGESVIIDTGSGSVQVKGDLEPIEELEIDTGSGSVVLESSTPPSLSFNIDTGSGRINVNLPDLTVTRDKRGDFVGTAGSGKGRASIDTGSGSVNVRMAKAYQFSSDEKLESEAKPVLKENKGLTERLRAKLNADADIRKAGLSISTQGDQAVIEGEVDSLWTIAKIIKLANEVDGIEGVKMDIDTED